MLVHVRERRPRADFRNLERDVERIFRSFSSDQGVAAQPNLEVTVTPNNEGVVLTAEVPGVEPSAINIAVDGRALTISGERSSETRREGTYRLRERSSGKFSRTFQLTDEFDTEAIDAAYSHGVLTVQIPKRAEAKPRQIAVKTS
jgi:HSP20 family protein